MLPNGRVGFIYAHPDDETFLSGCLIRQLADEGGKPVLLLATRGDAGFKNGDYSHVTREELGGIRDEEIAAASSLLGLDAVEQLG
ncbi:PIG-L deacetylase family protein [Cohnella silvisoli]|uniref:PIG-L family deacetylase n=1 Tax=Cohnella silvisoli TaxID=2873699 RepID=A0ABV1KZQ8_9BACL|nr:PIG-L family deacetylase [Cohnella silvisoli]MCD9021770.1 PIG-L family deacetylase [Cohnella silvisoli]